MINKSKLELILKNYKKDFPALFWTDKQKNEKYKWVAVKHFQDNWDIGASDFKNMLEQSLAKTENLLTSMRNYPKGMILNFAELEPETVRGMFEDLYDENIDLVERIEKFVKASDLLLSKYGSKYNWKSHYQSSNSITTYLWLKYPDEYYIYKYSDCKKVAAELDESLVLTTGINRESILGVKRLYDEMADYVASDDELVDIVKALLDDTCYLDPCFRTLAMDIGFYISRHYSQKPKEEVNGMETVNQAWYVGAYLGETDMFDTFISEGRWENGYEDAYLDDVKRMKPGERIVIKAAYTKIYVPFKTNGKRVSVMGIKAIGTITHNHNDGWNVDVKWDKVFEPKKEWYFFTMRNTLWNVERKKDDWMYGALLDFTFADVEQDYDRFLEHAYWKNMYMTEDESIGAVEPGENSVTVYELPTRNPREVKIYSLNTILYGAPGTGKTYSTAEYAMAILENREVNNKQMTVDERKKLLDKYKDSIKNGQIVFTTFHQSYGYEDFIQGMRPDNSSGSLQFKKVDGVFKGIADRAMCDPENNYVIIIDEINRANISKVFGELITLIEDDKRWGELNEVSVTLPMGDTFAVPNNLYIIGTMNTADKSISLIDTALRRRFDFVEVPVRSDLIEDPTLRQVLTGINNRLVEELDSSDLLIGHAYFMGKKGADLVAIMNRNIIPLLYEYFYDNAKKVKAIVEKSIEGLPYKVVFERTSRLRIEKKD